MKNMNDAMVSIIIPVYNVKDYISDCINSICTQTYKNLQIIIIDDGSTDGSSEICRSLAENDKRILYIHQDNNGVSSARNIGLDNAKGKYICFADGDDLLLPNCVEALIEKASDDNSLIISRYQKIDEKKTVICKSIEYPEEKINNTDAMDNLLELDSKFGYQGFLWNKLFMNEIIQKNKLRFTKGIIYNEDRLFVFQYLMTGCDAVFIQTVTYQYRIRSESAMGNINIAFSLKQLTELNAFIIIENQLCKNHSTLCIKANLATFYCAYDLYKRIPANDDKYIVYKRILKKHMKKRLFKILCNTSKFVTMKDRCRCLYYWLRVRMRIEK